MAVFTRIQPAAFEKKKKHCHFVFFSLLFLYLSIEQTTKSSSSFYLTNLSAGANT